LDPLSKLPDSNSQTHVELSTYIGGVLLKCCQTGKRVRARVSDLSKEDMTPIKAGDLTEGSNFIAELNGWPYPLQFLHFSGNINLASVFCNNIPHVYH